MSYSMHDEGDVAVIKISGKVTIGQGDIEVRESVHKALETGKRKIVLVLDQVTALDSSGVGELVAAHASTTNREGELKLAALSPKVAAVLQATQIMGVLNTHDSAEEALVDFARTN